MVADTSYWTSTSLGAVGRWLSGGTPSKAKRAYWDGEVPWVSPKDMKVSRISDAIDHVSEQALGNGTRLAPTNSLLLVVRGMILAHTFPVALAAGPVAFNQDIKALIPDDHVFPDYLLYWLQLQAPRVLAIVNEATHGTKRIPTEALKNLPLSLPPLGEQRKIAAVLASVDEAIEKTRKVIDQVQVVKKGLMQELLTRGLPGRHTRFKHTEIGEIPEGWDVSPIGELVSCCDYGLSTSLNASERQTPVLRMGNLQDGEVLMDDLKYVRTDLARQKGLLLDAGDVLFNRTNSAALVGKVGVFRGSDRDVSFASYLLRMKIVPSNGSGEWLSAILNTEGNQRLLRRFATLGVSQANINRTKLLSLRVPVPPVGEQDEIMAILNAIRLRMVAEEKKRRSLEEVKSGLMSVLLTGEVRVQPDEDAA